ncbi:MAG: DUF503 domain-containing protein [Gemmatimonadota bacterium]
MAAVVALSRWVLHLPASRSLKTKRQVVHGLRDRLQARFRVSAAETNFQNHRKMAELCAVIVTSDRTLADSILTRLDRVVASEPRATVVERERVFL